MRKPGWYLESDTVPMFVNEHVHNLRFLDAATPAAAVAPQITSPGEATATARQVFNHLITATALPTSFNAEGLPKGLTVDMNTGLVSGAPQVPGTYTITVSATNNVGTATKSLTVTVGHPA
ncbi:Ig domain-containing protein [Nonomuraea sp. SYSU D8015]|uniref:Ig domain-containing protein n=1 Tax=Nonomuraea sp. SYSU D8015 TaxID=2593644 RepID=UPI001CB72F3C|nr:Ig domain-containing protein [Nonomuraea sp. SYSU D8015]